MSYVQRHEVLITTAADGSATAYTVPVTGRVSRIVYVKGTFDNGVDFAITIERTAESLWTESNVNASAARSPRVPTHDGLGVASLYAAGGEPVEDKFALAEDRVKIAIAQGGNVKAGTFHVYVE